MGWDEIGANTGGFNSVVSGLGRDRGAHRGLQFSGKWDWVEIGAHTGGFDSVVS